MKAFWSTNWLAIAVVVLAIGEVATLACLHPKMRQTLTPIGVGPFIVIRPR